MGIFSEERIKAINERDAAYVKAYNKHYNDDNGFLPLYQFPALDLGDISLYFVSKVPEVGGTASLIYGIIDKDPVYIGAGATAMVFGFLFDLGVAPIRRMIRGKRILAQQQDTYQK